MSTKLRPSQGGKFAKPVGPPPGVGAYTPNDAVGEILQSGRAGEVEGMPVVLAYYKTVGVRESLAADLAEYERGRPNPWWPR